MGEVRLDGGNYGKMADELYEAVKPSQDDISRATHPTTTYRIDGMDTAAYYAQWRADADSTEQSSWYTVDDSIGWELTGWCNVGQSTMVRPLYRRIARSLKRTVPTPI